MTYTSQRIYQNHCTKIYCQTTPEMKRKIRRKLLGVLRKAPCRAYQVLGLGWKKQLQPKQEQCLFDDKQLQYPL